MVPGVLMALDGATTATVTTAMSTGLGTAASDALSAIAEVVLQAIPILGAVVVIKLAIKVFRKIAG